jgi:hypothetical protein
MRAWRDDIEVDGGEPGEGPARRQRLGSAALEGEHEHRLRLRQAGAAARAFGMAERDPERVGHGTSISDDAGSPSIRPVRGLRNRPSEGLRPEVSDRAASVVGMSDVVSILRGHRTGIGPRKGLRRAPAPMTGRAWFEQGVAHEAGGRLAEACAAYQRALDRAPDLADASCNLGRLLHESGDRAGAESCYRLALAADRGIAVYWFNLGVAVEDRAGHAEAIACYREALALDPHLADAHFNLARLYEHAGDLDSARAAIRHYRAYRALRRTA